MKPHWVRAAEYSGITPDERNQGLIDIYRDWLVTEAVVGGGIGPDEVNRIESRHLADSILFASGLQSTTGTVWDLGSGVGLPGIPLAICLPEIEFLLFDRSRRRVDLAQRAIRILGLANCQVVQGEIADLTSGPDALVSRATLPPDRLRTTAEHLLRPGGVAVAGGSWVQPPDHPGWDTIEIPPYVLDQPVWLLIMRRE